MYKYNPEQTFGDGDIYQNPVEDNMCSVKRDIKLIVLNFV